MAWKPLTFTLLVIGIIKNSHGLEEPQKSVNIFLNEADQLLRSTLVNCQHLSDNFTKSTLEEKLKIISDLEICGKNLENISRQAREYNLETIDDATNKQALLMLRNIESPLKMGSYVVESKKNLETMKAAFELQNIEVYDDDQMLSLEDIKRMGILETSNSVEELNYYWRTVADKVKNVAEEPFFNYVKLVRRVAKNYNLTAAEFWYPNYTAEKMLQLEEIMQNLKPFYMELQAYTRFKILQKYGAGVIKPNGPIPEHLYRQIQQRAWSEHNKYLNGDFTAENLPSYEEIFISSGHEPNAHEILELAQNFYVSLGFDDFTHDFWLEHIKQTTTSNDNDDDCRSFVVDDGIPDNVTLFYCQDNDLDAFAAQHEHLGRIHSALLKQKLPIYFYDRNSLGEPFGRAVKLSAFTAEHLKKIGLAKDYEFTEEVKQNINFRLAFETMFTLNYEYIHARLITDFLDGKVKKKQLNRHYWQLLEEYAGIEPPVDRHEDSFDLPFQLIVKFMKNHNLIRDLENSILTFQFYQTACEKIGRGAPLNDCDFYNRREVGSDFKQALSQGASKPFEAVIRPLLTVGKLDAVGIIAYFDITFEWLKKYNAEHKLAAGWQPTNKQTYKELFHSETDALNFIKNASDKIYELFNQISEDLFLDKNQANEYADDTFGAMFWKISKSAIAASELKDISLEAKKISASNFKDSNLKRALKSLARIGDIFVIGAEMEDLYRHKSELYNISLARDIPAYNTTTKLLSLYPDIRNIYLHSNSEAELKYYWVAWRQSNSAWARSLLLEMFKAFETAARILEIPVAEFWFKHFNAKFVDRMEKVIQQTRPLYNSIHYYVKMKLIEKYGRNILSKPDGAIPDHLVEQVLLQIWTPESIIEKDFPFRELPPHEQFVQAKHKTALDWLKTAEDFYTSMGFEPLAVDFWQARLSAQTGSTNTTNCHATIFDMTPKVYMKYCDQISYRKLLQAHGYMGRLHYAVEKRDLPAYFFDSYFLEYPVGEAVILSASTPKHSKTIGLFDNFPINAQVLLNRQLRMAIHTLFNLHKYFVHTKVMLGYLQGEITANKIGKFYWRYMLKYAGIEPPVNRDVEHFDFPFEFYTDLEQNHQVKKFVSEILGYQIYERLCKLSGHTGDLNNCDFYGSSAAGEALIKMMKLGSSKPRKVVLKSLLSVNGMSAESLLHYYEPLSNWFQQHNIPKDKSFGETLRTFKG